jgi:hypothetical protein
MAHNQPSTADQSDVRFGSEADMCNAPTHVRFAPNSDRESRHAANGHVRFTLESRHVRRNQQCRYGPRADIEPRSVQNIVFGFAGVRQKTVDQSAKQKAIPNASG